MMYVKNIFTFLLASLLLIGCSAQAPVPVDRFYRLPDIANKSQKKVLEGMMVVRPLRASGLYTERSMLYIDQSHPLEVQRYHYHYWMYAPGYLVQENMLSYLKKASFADQVNRYEPGTRYKHQVTGRVLRFERIIGKDAITMNVKLELNFYSGSRLLLTRAYSSTKKAHGNRIHDSVHAMSVALEDIYQQFMQDVSRLK